MLCRQPRLVLPLLHVAAAMLQPAVAARANSWSTYLFWCLFQSLVERHEKMEEGVIAAWSKGQTDLGEQKGVRKVLKVPVPW